MFKSVIGNFILYSAAFIISLTLKKNTFNPHEGYSWYYLAFIVSWGISVLFSRKFKAWNNAGLLNKLYTNTLSFFIMLGSLTLIMYEYNLTGVSRFIILTALIIPFVIESIFLIYSNKDKIVFINLDLIYNIRTFIYDIILFGIINLYIIYELEGSIYFNGQNLFLFVSFFLCWYIGFFFGHQFEPEYPKANYWQFIWRYIKTYIIILSLSLFIGFLHRLEINDIYFIGNGIIIYSFLSLASISTIFYINHYRIMSVNIVSFLFKGESGDFLLNETVPDRNNFYKSSFHIEDSEALNTNLKNISLKRYPEVFDFIHQSIDLNSFDNTYSLILKSDNLSNIDYLPNSTLELFINLMKINRVHNINKYLAEVNNKLMQNGIFVCNFETGYLRHQNFLKNYPYYLTQIIYFIDFILNRVFSKIIFLKNIYSLLTGRTHKALSLAEGLGRLYFSGFELLHARIIEGSMYLILKKVKEPLKDIHPSTGLIFKMKRFGKDGELINVYKLRTMHPYAEYLQNFIYEKYNLQQGGKFNNDFRITYWGNILRRLWLDELPMIYNWLTGDLKLIGCRPISFQYFNLYNEELKQLRLKFKPGLIPPFYADNPKTLDEIMESEKKYLKLYEVNPILTDIKYFFKCLYNIFIKGARSG